MTTLELALLVELLTSWAQQALLVVPTLLPTVLTVQTRLLVQFVHQASLLTRLVFVVRPQTAQHAVMPLLAKPVRVGSLQVQVATVAGTD